MSPLLYVLPAVFLLNLPFGFWRVGVRKFSPAWFVSIHGPIPVVVLIRILSGLGFQLATVPMVAAAYFAGQFVGGRIRRHWNTRSAPAAPGGEERA